MFMSDDDPMQRRMMQIQDESPEMLIHQGLEHADNPEVPMDYETRMSVIEPLLMAKMFKGQAPQLSQFRKGQQGEITMPADKGDKKDALGMIKTVGSLVAML